MCQLIDKEVNTTIPYIDRDRDVISNHSPYLVNIYAENLLGCTILRYRKKKYLNVVAFRKEITDMLSNTFSHFKNLVKGGFNFVKDATFGTITAVKNDICQELEIRKEVKAVIEARKASASSEKSE